MTAHFSSVNRRLKSTGPYTYNYGKDPQVIYGIVVPRPRNVASDRSVCDFDRSFHQRDVRSFFRKPDLSIEFDENDRNSFTPRLELVNKNGEPSGVTRQYVKIRVKNNGGIIARNCRAKLKVVKNTTKSRCPSDNKNLAWDTTDSRYLDIAKDDDEFLHVFFSDSNLDQIRVANNNIDIYAMTSTIESMYGEQRFIRAQDAFGVGEFEIEIRVLSEEGSWSRAKYRFTVGQLYTSLSLDFISHKQSRTAKRLFSKLISPIRSRLIHRKASKEESSS